MSKKNKDLQPNENLSVKQKRALEREKAQQEKKKTIKIAVTVIIIIALLLAVSLFINSNFIRRNFTAITVGDRDFTAAEFNVAYFSYYYNYYDEMFTTFADYAAELLPDNSKPLKSQIYDAETGETWAERMESYALTSLEQYVAWYNEAQSIGFVMPEEKREQMEEELASLEDSAAYYQYTKVDDYLASMYGKGVNYEIFAEMLEFIFIAESYDEYYSDNLIYSEEEIIAQYESKRDMYDSYAYRYFIYEAEDVEKSDFAADEEEEYNAARKEALAAIKDDAETLFKKIKTEEDMIKYAKEYDSEKYADADSTYRKYNGEVLGSVYGEWMRAADRKEGDTYFVEVASGTGYYLVYYIGRDDNHYKTVNLDMIQIDPAKVDSEDYADEEDDTAYDAAVEQAKKDAKVEAEELLQAWKDEGGTRDLFLQYIDDNSDALSGDGQYENVYKSQFEEDIENWAYDKIRKEGDTTVIYSEEKGAYLIIHFSGTGEYYNYDLARTDLKTHDYEAWVESLTEGIEVETKWVFALTK